MTVSGKNQLVQQVLDSREAPSIIKELNSALETEMQKRQAFYDAMSTEELKTEFINGEVIVHSPVKIVHNEISLNLAFILRTYVSRNKLGFVGHEKIMVRLSRNDYEPDVCYFNNSIAKDFEKGQSLFPAPSLAVEVLSKNTAGRDRGIKMQDYAAHGVEEYWIIDAQKERLEQYVLEGKQFELHKKSNEGQLHSVSVAGLSFPIEAIFNEQKAEEVVFQILSTKN
ncbi:MAG: Uma2 family endonuclease [Bacteroidota bacterium]